MPSSASSSLALAETKPVSGQLDETMRMGMQGANRRREDAPFRIRSRGGRRRGLARGHASEGVVVGGERHEAVRCWIRYYLMFLRARADCARASKKRRGVKVAGGVRWVTMSSGLQVVIGRIS